MKKFKIISNTIVIMSLFLAVSSVSAKDKNKQPTGEGMVHSCVACHSATDNTEYIPSLTNMTKEQFVVSMRAFRSGERQSVMMERLAKAFTDAEIDSMAQFLWKNGE